MDSVSNKNTQNIHHVKNVRYDIFIGVFAVIAGAWLSTSLNFADLLHEVTHSSSNNQLHIIGSLFVGIVLAFVLLTVRHFIRLKTLLRQLEKAQKELKAQSTFRLQQNKLVAIGELSGGLAHEINNALVPAIGMGDILKRRLEKESPDLVPFIDTIYSSSMHARKIVQNVLAFARSQDINSDMHDWSDVLQEAVQISKDIITTPDIHLDIQETKADEVNYVKVNKTAITQLFGNLFKNANDAMPDGGTITIRFQKQEINSDMGIKYELSECDYLIVTVTDTGTGIQTDVLEQIFDPFFTTKDVDKGTGLGLATVYGTMRNLGGNISVQSKVGTGTTFTLYFPVSDPNLFQLSQNHTSFQHTGEEYE